MTYGRRKQLMFVRPVKRGSPRSRQPVTALVQRNIVDPRTGKVKKVRVGDQTRKFRSAGYNPRAAIYNSLRKISGGHMPHTSPTGRRRIRPFRV